MKKLQNYNKSKRLNGTTKGKIGTKLNLLDKENNFLCVGDKIQYQDYIGYLLYNPSCERYGIALEYSMWYGDNIYDINSYGKFIELPMDNGGKMSLLRL